MSETNYWRGLEDQLDKMKSSDPLGFGTMALDMGFQGLDAATTAFGNIGKVVTAAQNNKIAMDTLDYNKWFNEKTWEREDTAVRRRMEDLKAAGLNPLLAAGQAATSGGGGTLTAPELQFPTFQSAKIDLANSYKQAQERKIAQDNLDMAMQQRNDEHNMSVKQLKLAENQIKAVELDNESKRYDNAVKAATVQEEIDSIGLKNQQLFETIQSLRAQTQTESTKQALNQAQTELAQSRARQQQLETEIYSTYGAAEKAAEIRKLDTEYHDLLAKIRYDKANFYLQSEYEKLRNKLQAMANSLYEHDLEIYLKDTDKTSTAQDKTSDALTRFLSNEGVTVSGVVLGLLTKALLAGGTGSAPIGFQP